MAVHADQLFKLSAHSTIEETTGRVSVY